MKFATSSKLVLAAVMSVGLAGLVHAKDLQPQDQQIVRAGMSQSEVEQALGKPARTQHFGLSNTTTWSYKTSDYFERSGDRIYEVDFGADGTVISAGPRNLPNVDSNNTSNNSSY